MGVKKFMDNLGGVLSHPAPASFASEKDLGSMDNLSADALEATQAGMSYGQWKPMHPYTKALREAARNEKETKHNGHICKHCGRAFIPRFRKAKQLYCSDECRDAANNKRARERARRIAELGGQNNGKLCAEN